MKHFVVKCLRGEMSVATFGLLRPDRHTGRTAGHAAVVFKSYKNPVPGRIKGHIGVALDKDPESRRLIGIDLCSDAGANR